MKLSFVLALLMPFGALAQGFAPLSLADTGDVCYSWSGDTRTSAGSFSRCNPVGYVKPSKPAVVSLPAPAIAPSPIMMPMTCPPPQTPVVRKKRPAPKKC